MLTVIVRAALSVPLRWLPKAIDNGETFATGPTPVPDSGTLCGLPGALLVTSMLAERTPTAVGLKRTLIEHDLVGASVDPAQLLVRTKSLGLASALATAEMVTLAAPVLVTVTVRAVLVVPTAWLPKATLVGVKLRLPIATPVPLKATP